MTSTPLVAPMALDDGHLERAKQNLVDGVDLFGLQEHFDEFCDALTARYGWDLGRPRFAQRTQKQPVSAALTERIAEDNRLDLKLYDFAVSVRDEQSR
jgi:hypothetical protein